jgi:hypothetical protein
MHRRNTLQSGSSKRLLWFFSLLAVAAFLTSGCGRNGEFTTGVADSNSFEALSSSDSKGLSPAAAAGLVRPANQQNMQFQRAGVFKRQKQIQGNPAYSEEEKNRVLDAFKRTDSADVKAALLPGFARQQNYTAMPLIIDSVKADSLVLSGRAIATAEHLLGVRYNMEVSELKSRKMRYKIAGMIEKDWQQLQHYPRFKSNIE